MDDIIEVNESSGAPVKAGKRWLVTIARPGQGTTGTYSEEVLKATGPTAFPPGTKSYFKHAATEDRDPRDQVGVFKDGAFWNDEAGELQALLTPFPRYRDVLDQAAEGVEASIHAAARKDAKLNVKELVYRRDNTVDLVAFAGLEGSGLKYQVESLFATAAADDEQGKKKENNVEIDKAIEALTSKLETLNAKFDTFVAESKTEVKGEADATALAAGITAGVEEAFSAYAESEAAIDAADVPAKVKESLKASARKGEDITGALEFAVSVVAESKTEAPAPKTPIRGKVVVVAESLDSDKPKNFTVPGWKRS